MFNSYYFTIVTQAAAPEFVFACRLPPKIPLPSSSLKRLWVADRWQGEEPIAPESS